LASFHRVPPLGYASHLHFWLSAIPAFAFLLLVPILQAFSISRPSLLADERGSIAILIMMTVSTLLFLLGQMIFVVNCISSALYRNNG